MKLTKSQLKQIIKEELENTIREQGPAIAGKQAPASAPDPNVPGSMPKPGSTGALAYTLRQHNEQMKRLGRSISQLSARVDKLEGVTSA